MLLAMSRNMSRFIALPILLLYIGGCATTDRATIPVVRTDDSPGWLVSVGDDLVVTTTEGQVYEFVLQDIDEDYLVGEDVKVATKDISKVEVRVEPATAILGFSIGLAIGYLITALFFGLIFAGMGI